MNLERVVVLVDWFDGVEAEGFGEEMVVVVVCGGVVWLD